MAKLAPQEEIESLRKPSQLFTADFLNSPVRFDTPKEILPETLARQEQLMAVVERDLADFVHVNLNAKTKTWYPVGMFRVLFNRNQFQQIFIDLSNG
jgi:hypothetical protein